MNHTGCHHLPNKHQDVHPVLFQCWAIVFGAGPTLKQHWADVTYLLGIVYGLTIVDHIRVNNFQ